jgi:hypothetical protein
MTTAEAFVYILLLHSQDIISNEKNIMHAQTVEDITIVSLSSNTSVTI